MRVQIVSSRPRPKIGDRRVTKRHGLQIRVAETSRGMWVLRNGRQAYEWRTLAQLVGTSFEHLIPWPRAWPQQAPVPQACAGFPGTCRGGEVVDGRLSNGLRCKASNPDGAVHAD